VKIASRGFASKNVVQRRRYMGRILHPKQTDYVPKPPGYQPLPVSLLASSTIRRIVKTDSQEALDLAAKVDWDRYKCSVAGVRWHPNGSWRVQFRKSNVEHNFYVNCSCYFRTALYGFDAARERAIAYRDRLQAEWEELEQTWKRMDRLGGAGLPRLE